MEFKLINRDDTDIINNAIDLCKGVSRRHKSSDNRMSLGNNNVYVTCDIEYGNSLVIYKGGIDEDLISFVKRAHNISKLIFDRVSLINFSRMYLGFLSEWLICHSKNYIDCDGNVFSINLISVITTIMTMYPDVLSDSEIVYKTLYVLNPKK